VKADASGRIDLLVVFRNSLFLYHRFGRPEARKPAWNFLKSRFFSRKYPLSSKTLFVIALMDHIRYIPFLLSGMGRWRGNHPGVRLEETSLSH
jgi:hypothetical protein